MLRAAIILIAGLLVPALFGCGYAAPVMLEYGVSAPDRYLYELSYRGRQMTIHIARGHLEWKVKCPSGSRVSGDKLIQEVLDMPMSDAVISFGDARRLSVLGNIIKYSGGGSSGTLSVDDFNVITRPQLPAEMLAHAIRSGSGLKITDNIDVDGLTCVLIDGSIPVWVRISPAGDVQKGMVKFVSSMGVVDIPSDEVGWITISLNSLLRNKSAGHVK